MPSRRKAPKGPERRGGRRRTTWKPGIPSPNPKGRQPLPPEYREAIGKIGERALEALDSIVANDRHPRHEQAVEYALNRWKGTPTVKTEVSGPAGGPVEVKTVLTSDEKRARVAATIAAANARVAGRGTPDAG